MGGSIRYALRYTEKSDISSDFFVFFRRKFSENSENSPKIQKIPRKFRKPMNQSPQQQQQQQQRRKGHAENSRSLFAG